MASITFLHKNLQLSKIFPWVPEGQVVGYEGWQVFMEVFRGVLDWFVRGQIDFKNLP